VSLVDLAPTLLELLGLDDLDQAQGISLVGSLRGEPLPERPLFFGWLRQQAEGVRFGRWKFWRLAGRRRLFDLERDPGERSAVRNPDQEARAEELLARHAAASLALKQALAAPAEPDAPGVSEQVLESLRALGYLED
jgi:arylsulfatase A-like enzyme